VQGFVAPGAALRRDGARVGDGVWVSGTLGDAAAALAQWRAHGAIEGIDAALRQRLERPLPRIAFGRALGGLAHACLDVSDGLLADLGHVCVASGMGADVDVDALPASAALQACFAGDALRALQAGGGDDYELCFTAPASADRAIQAAGRAADLAVTRIGTVVATTGVRAHCAGKPWVPPRSGHVHFDS
jgi:thiamine-monophosphate kinase